MFADMFKPLFETSSGVGAARRAPEQDPATAAAAASRRVVKDMLARLVDDDQNSACSGGGDNVVDAMELLSIADNDSDRSVVRCDSHGENEASSVGENRPEPGSVGRPKDEYPDKQKLINKIDRLHCMFTWNLKPIIKKDVVSRVRNKYGDYNLDISSPEFTFERYIGNLVIGYELFRNGDTELGQMKILEIGKWLEELDGVNNNTNEWYLSIRIGLKHVMSSVFVHMLFASNLFEECNWISESITPIFSMDPRSKATVLTVRAAVLIEYGGHTLHFKKACKCAKIACDLDPGIGYWFYVYSLALTAQRQFLNSMESRPTHNEFKTIQQAIGLTDGRNTTFNYHRMILDRDATVWSFQYGTITSDELVIEKNLYQNQTLVRMIQTIVSMKPKDPLLVVKCAQALMNLSYEVRDLKLAKIYFEIALEMAPNDSVVLNAISKAIEIYNKTYTSKQAAAETDSKLREHLASLLRKHNDGKNVLPNLTYLLIQDKYSESEKLYIRAQVCSYTILFDNDLGAGIQHFMSLINHPSFAHNSLIEEHFSIFGSKKFHLAELICNEIRLATNSSGKSSDDMLFYYKTLTILMETFNIKLKDVDSSMKANLIIHTSTRFTGS